MSEQLTLGENIKRLRTAKGMPQKALADAIGVSQQVVSMYEGGIREPTVRNVRAMASVLGCSMGELCGEPKAIHNPPTGRWQIYQFAALGKAWTVQCSRCKAIGFHGQTPYCPECGARMTESEVVRCGDCKFYREEMNPMDMVFRECHAKQWWHPEAPYPTVSPDDFCSFGQRKMTEEEEWQER